MTQLPKETQKNGDTKENLTGWHQTRNPEIPVQLPTLLPLYLHITAASRFPCFTLDVHWYDLVLSNESDAVRLKR